ALVGRTRGSDQRDLPARRAAGRCMVEISYRYVKVSIGYFRVKRREAMPTSRGSYNHFCPAARALEVIGGKWSILIVRDLLGGPRRFSDLRRTLADITSKWLSARLPALERGGGG